MAVSHGRLLAWSGSFRAFTFNPSRPRSAFPKLFPIQLSRALPRILSRTKKRERNQRVALPLYDKTGAPVAGACCLHWRGELEVTWASSLREYNRGSPNMLQCRASAAPHVPK